MAPLIPFAIIGGLAFLLLGGKDDKGKPPPAGGPDGEEEEPEPIGGTGKEPPPGPPDEIVTLKSDSTTTLGRGIGVHLRTRGKILDPEGAGVFVQRQNLDGTFRNVRPGELAGLGWSVIEPDREYVVDTGEVPGRYRIQAMEEPSFDSVFLDVWTIDVRSDPNA